MPDGACRGIARMMLKRRASYVRALFEEQEEWGRRFRRKGGGGGVKDNSPMLIVACREITSGVSGVSSSIFRFVKSCAARNACSPSIARRYRFSVPGPSLPPPRNACGDAVCFASQWQDHWARKLAAATRTCSLSLLFDIAPLAIPVQTAPCLLRCCIEAPWWNSLLPLGLSSKEVRRVGLPLCCSAVLLRLNA